MTPSKRHWFGLQLLISCVVVGGAIAVSKNCALAQLSPDGTLGIERTQVTSKGPGDFQIDGGATRGTNLFHSFNQFSVPTGGSAYFNNAPNIQNVFSRVTGGSISNIDGLIRANGTANLFLLNPNGIIFGPNAALKINGSFLASTASSFKFVDGSEFSATNPQAPPLLTINPQPGLQWGLSQPAAMIVNRGNLAAGQELTLASDNLDLQGQLQAGRDLTLQAQKTLQVRDSIEKPFLAQAGGNLTLQGDRGIDILALNHPMQTPFVSGGNLSLISDGTISGDAHFASGGNFSIRSVAGGRANFVSQHDPIISANGDVDVAANYTGASLLVETKGNIRFQGAINITGPDTSGLPAGPDTATLSRSSALILRSGQKTLTYGGSNFGSVPTFGTGGVPLGITIGGVVTLEPFNGTGGVVNLSAASGNVSTQLISTNGQKQNPHIKDKPYFIPPNDANGGAISLVASSGSITTGDLYSYSYSDSGIAKDGGAINLVAPDGSITTGNLFSFSRSDTGMASSGGAISLFAPNGNITTNGLYSYSEASNFPSKSENGGAIHLESSSGINITGDVFAYSHADNNGPAGSGGAISLRATRGSISTNELNSESHSGFPGGDGGAIDIEATNGGISTGILSSDSFSNGFVGGNGGAIHIETLNGNINTGDVYARSTPGNGGAIHMKATNGNIVTGGLSSYSSTYDVDVTTRDGGAISLEALNGSITTSFVASYSSSYFPFDIPGNGGMIIIKASNDINIAGANSYSSSFAGGTAGNGGAIYLKTSQGSITTSGDLNSSSYSGDGRAGRGGEIHLEAYNAINLLRQEFDDKTFTFKLVPGGSINSTGGLGSGNITILSKALLALNSSIITSDTFGSGKGGDIQLSAPSISLTNAAQVSASTHSTGQGGNIALIASNSVELSGATSKAPFGIFSDASFAGTPPGTYLGGFIPTGHTRQPPEGTIFPSGLFTQTTTGSIGNAGTLRIETGQLSVKDGAALATTTFGQGNAGNISVLARDLISVANGSILSGVAGEARGDSGAIALQTRSLSITGGGIVQTQTLGEGKAGAIQVDANDAVSLSGHGSGLRSGSGGSNNLLGNLGSKIGQGGDINVTTGSLSVADGAVLDAQTQSNSKGGDITVNANTLSAVNGGQLLTSTSGGGQAGDITVNAAELQLDGSSSGLFAQTTKAGQAGNLTLQPLGEGQSLMVDLLNGAQISASTSSSGHGGTLTVTAPESITLSGNGSLVSAGTSGSGTGGDLSLNTGTLTVRDGAQVRAGSSGEGNGGNLIVDASNSVQLFGPGSGLFVDATSGSIAGNLTVATRQMTVSDGAQVTVSSPFGQAGNLTIQANSLRLNRGTVLAETGKSSPEGGANIKLSGLDLLRLDNESLISANAFSQANGGNIKIDSTFVIATPPTDPKGSDITANAGLGNGGAVNITTQGLFGIQFRPRLTPKNDITVSSDFGLNGTFQLNTPGIDPSRGVANLPTTPVDASRQIAQGCPASVGPRASKFVVTGRGGLPPTPQEATRNESPLADLGTPVPAQDYHASAEAPINSTSAEPIPLVEAQGWMINAKGEVVLTAQALNGIPHSLWLNPTNCHAAKTSL